LTIARSQNLQPPGRLFLPSMLPSTCPEEDRGYYCSNALAKWIIGARHYQEICGISKRKLRTVELDNSGRGRHPMKGYHLDDCLALAARRTRPQEEWLIVALFDRDFKCENAPPIGTLIGSAPPIAAKPRKHRARRSPLTPAQIEAFSLVMEHKGNVSAAA